MDEALPARALRAFEAAILAPAMKPLDEALGPVGSIAFASALQRCFDAGDR